jgi:C-terminal processing protease CtpA/Prc
MNKKLLLTSLALGALSITLIALPGSSARMQDCDNCTVAARAAKLRQLKAVQVVEASPAILSQEIDNTVIQDIEDDPNEAQGNVQVFLGSDGSWLGVETSEVTQQKAKDLHLPAERGAVVGKVLADSPAAKAGLKQNDVVTEINGQRVEGTAQFRRMIHEIPAGRPVQLTVWRDGRSQTISATLGKSEARRSSGMMNGQDRFSFRMPNIPEMPEIAGLGDLSNFAFMTPSQTRLGIDAEDLQGDFGSYFGAPDGEGVLVREVFPDSPAAKAGLKAGDVITSVGGERVRTTSELRDKLRGGHDATKSLPLGVLRNKSSLNLSVELPAPQKYVRSESHRTNL